MRQCVVEPLEVSSTLIPANPLPLARSTSPEIMPVADALTVNVAAVLVAVPRLLVKTASYWSPLSAVVGVKV